jgi:hypothetical protein
MSQSIRRTAFATARSHGQTPTQLADEDLKLYGRLIDALLLLDGSMPDLLSAAMKISTDLYKSLGIRG